MNHDETRTTTKNSKTMSRLPRTFDELARELLTADEYREHLYKRSQEDMFRKWPLARRVRRYGGGRCDDGWLVPIDGEMCLLTDAEAERLPPPPDRPSKLARDRSATAKRRRTGMLAPGRWTALCGNNARMRRRR